jgi:hypothetical protein
MTRKLNEQEKNDLSIELAEKICEREQLIVRKIDFNTGIKKEIKLLDSKILEIARELNDNEFPDSARDELVGAP